MASAFKTVKKPMEKLLLAALIMRTCQISYAMDIIDIPTLDGLRPPNVNTVVLLELVKSLNFTTLGRQKALTKLQDILNQRASNTNSCQQSTPQQSTGQKKATHIIGKL